MRNLNQQEITHVSGGNALVNGITAILNAEKKLLTGIFNLLTFNAFVKK